MTTAATASSSSVAARKKKEAKSSDEKEYFKLPIVCDVDTLRSLIRRKKSVRIVDVRKAEDYQREHIPTAVSLPLARVLENDQPEKIVAFLEELGISDTTPVVVYDDTFGALAARVAWTFQYVGHDNTALLEMTFKQWKELGLETENQQRTFPKVKHSINIRSDMYADAPYVEAATTAPPTTQSKSGTLLVDSRERLNYLTEHIPRAKNIPYTMVGSQESILRKAEELKRLIENRGITNDSEIITYCGSVGTLSGLTFYALKLAGFKNVKLYPKSFKEWKALGKPKEEFKDANYWDLSAE
ncbi:MAG TPA: rhodanese-like domain-containing protein [Nitrososphaera sp.]|nr:rhodanese-like domain-containing protein [Nitrososphaera sp.]